MDGVTLDHLPTLVLHKTCSILWEDSPPDLLEFSKVNKACREAAAPFVFKSRVIKVSNRKRLEEDVQLLKKSVFGAGCRQFLRNLRVEGTMPLLKEDFGQRFQEDELARLERLDAKKKEDHPFLSFSRTLRTYGDPLEDNREEIIRAWSPVADFISNLKFLTDLTFSCANQIPPSLLEALHEHHPTCRLHLPRFRIRRLDNRSLDADELAIVTSPCLHSLRLRLIRFNFDGKYDCNEEAIKQVVTLAPNLHHLTIASSTVLDPPVGPLLSAAGQTQWQGFVPTANSGRRAHIKSLELCCYQSRDIQSLWVWENRIDFSKLEVLVLSHVFRIAIFANAAVQHKFASLKELSIHLIQFGNVGNFESQAEIFFRNLQPLTILRLMGFVTNGLVNIITTRHGSTLHNLRIRPEEPSNRFNVPDRIILQRSDLLDMAEKCPNLRDLHLPIRRYKSGPREYECYEALGKFPSLINVTLTLECAKPGGPNISGTNTVEDEAAISLRMQELYVNCAVDEMLSRTIWEIIASNKSRICGLGQLRIKTLIHSDALTGFHSKELSHRLQFIAGSYLLQLRPNTGTGDDDIEVIDRALFQRNDMFDAYQVRRMRTPEELRHIMQAHAAFLVVWPMMRKGASWRENWNSRPLQTSD